MLRVGFVMFVTVNCLAQVHPSLFQKGVNFTAEGRDYASPEALELLLKLKNAYGINAIALVPYGFARKGIPRLYWNRPGNWEKDEAVTRIADRAHELGIAVMLKPHVWVRPGWPGDLDFQSASDRTAWFAEYGRFVEHYAKLATKMKAEVFCVGNEFGKLTRYEAEWRKLIRLARRNYKGAIVYAALQGAEFETLAFWDELDYIGLNNYYPLPDDLSTNEVVQRVETVQRRFRKPVIFPEAGFASLEAAHRAPWDETRGKVSVQDQAQAYEAVLKAFWDKPWFKGVYWWKVGSNGYGGLQDHSHTPWGKPAMDVVGKWYKKR